MSREIFGINELYRSVTENEISIKFKVRKRRGGA